MKARIKRYVDALGRYYWGIEGVTHTFDEVMLRTGQSSIEVDVAIDPHPRREAPPSEVHNLARPTLNGG